MNFKLINIVLDIIIDLNRFKILISAIFKTERHKSFVTDVLVEI